MTLKNQARAACYPSGRDSRGGGGGQDAGRASHCSGVSGDVADSGRLPRTGEPAMAVVWVVRAVRLVAGHYKSNQCVVLMS